MADVAAEIRPGPARPSPRCLRLPSGTRPASARTTGCPTTRQGRRRAAARVPRRKRLRYVLFALVPQS